MFFWEISFANLVFPLRLGVKKSVLRLPFPGLRFPLPETEVVPGIALAQGLGTKATLSLFS